MWLKLSSEWWLEGSNLICEPRTGGTTQWRLSYAFTHRRQPLARNSSFPVHCSPSMFHPPPNQAWVLQKQQKILATAKRFTGAADKRQSTGHFSLLTLELTLSSPLSCGHEQGVPSHKDLDLGASLPHRMEVCFLHREPSLGTKRDQWKPSDTGHTTTPKQDLQGSDI